MIKIASIVYLYLVAQMSVAWVLYRWLKNPSVVDVIWSLGLMIAGLIYLASQPLVMRNIVIGILLVLWSARLAGYLWWTRIRKRHVDKRYLQLSDNWKIAKPLGFFLNFQLQGVFIFLLSIVFLFAADRLGNDFTLLDQLACLIVVAGILGESIADWQLYHFKLHNKGGVCNVGLWRYSRHPNYFFDWMTWCGFALFGLQHEYGCFSLISPLVLYVIFTRITGPITEQGSIQSRGQAFLDYQKNTSPFFPAKPGSRNFNF